jgi:hypothetical protein
MALCFVHTPSWCITSESDELAQVDIGIKNTGIYFSLANPYLKNNEGERRKFNEGIALQFIAVNSIDSALDAIDSGTICKPGDSDDEDIIEQV